MNPRVLTTLAALLALYAIGAPAEEPPADRSDLLAIFREEFVDITPGQGVYPVFFEMGRGDGPAAERPPHRVTPAGAFAIARYEVPQNLWQAVMRSNPSRWKGPRNSVEMLSHDDAVEFCRRATEQMRAAKLIRPRQVVRLPSEAEWEYAARAGTTSRYSFGDDAGKLDEYAWSTQNASGNDPAVGEKKPNAWDLYDMHGYLWEWCADAWHDDYDGAPQDGTARASGTDARRVLRGGSWKDPAETLTSTFRRPAKRGLKNDAVGLRCVLADEPPP